MTQPAPTGWTGEPLPRGRHKLPRETVEASQRERIMRAMTELVEAAGDEGSRAITVTQIAATARVSTNTFYKNFADKADCFFAYISRSLDEFFAIYEPVEESATPAEFLAALRANIRASQAWWAARPAVSRAYFLEMPASGARGVQERRRQAQRLEHVILRTTELGRRIVADPPPMRDIDAIAVAVAMDELDARYIEAGRTSHLDELSDDMYYLWAKLFVADAAAADDRRTSRSPQGDSAFDEPGGSHGRHIGDGTPPRAVPGRLPAVEQRPAGTDPEQR